MNTSRRTVTIAAILAVVSCATIWTLQLFAQDKSSRGAGFRLEIKGSQRAQLKSDYVANNFKKFDDLLNANAVDSDLTDELGHPHKGKKLSSLRPQNVTLSEIIKVQNTSVATPTVSSKITGVNVTQNFSTASPSDMTAILAAFE